MAKFNLSIECDSFDELVEIIGGTKAKAKRGDKNAAVANGKGPTAPPKAKSEPVKTEPAKTEPAKTEPAAESEPVKLTRDSVSQMLAKAAELKGKDTVLNLLTELKCTPWSKVSDDRFPDVVAELKKLGV